MKLTRLTLRALGRARAIPFAAWNRGTNPQRLAIWWLERVDLYHRRFFAHQGPVSSTACLAACRNAPARASDRAGMSESPRIARERRSDASSGDDLPLKGPPLTVATHGW